MEQARSFVKEHKILLLAIFLCLSYHGGMVFWTFRGTYDAWVHIFFADHWRRTLFDHWNYRWYTGFPMVGYPPGSQQTVGMLSKLIGLESAFAVVQLFAVTNCTIGIYRFSKIWATDSQAPGYAALYFVFCSSITETIHTFGQLPTTFSLGFILNTIPFMYRWLREGKVNILLVAWIWNAATTAGHHVTTLFGAVFFLAPVMVLAIVQDLQIPVPGESEEHPSILTRKNLWPLIWRRIRRVLPTVLRCGVYGVGMIALLVIVVLPYWIWSINDPITQVSIPHSSRDSFLVNTSAGLVFWLVPYGVGLIALPYAFYKGFTTKAWPMTLSLAMLVLLGTGGTTPIPEMLLGGAFHVLTLDRFTFWATITVQPLIGEFIRSLVDGRLSMYVIQQFGKITLRTIQVFLLVSFLAFSLFAANLTQLRTFQPDPIDMEPLVRFIEKDEHWKWRYLTLGFGDQVAWLGAQTTAVSVDGNYHSARRLPELTTTPIERLEGAKFRGIAGIGSLQQFLATPDKYRLKFVFSNDQFYDPLLYFSGWHRIGRLENGIMIWERADIPALPEELPRKEIPYWQRAMFGILPMGFLALAMIVASMFIWGKYAQIAMEITGIFPFFRWAFNPLVTRSIRLWEWIDGKMELWSRLREPASGEEAWWHVWVDRATNFELPMEAAPSAKIVRSGLLALCALTIVSGVYLKVRQIQLDPIKQVEGYYDDLDFRRFRDAHARLAPDLAKPFDDWLLDMTSTGGMLASYAKLDNIKVRILEEEEERILIEVDLDWISSLNEYNSTHQLELVQRDGNDWYIVPLPLDIKQAPDKFYRQGTVAWQVNSGARAEVTKTSFKPLEDRPELQILSSRLVLEDGRYFVVGELINLDVDPADLTVAGHLFDSEGETISWYNAQKVISHKIFPKEITPFRVDFEGVAGMRVTDRDKIGTFHPDDYSPIDLEKPIDSFVVYAKAVVTPHDLNRDVGVQNIKVTAEEIPDAVFDYVNFPEEVDDTIDGRIPVFFDVDSRDDGKLRGVINGTLINHGTIEAIIPQLLVTYYNDLDEVVWVDSFYLTESVKPQKELDFEVKLKPIENVRLIDNNGSDFSNVLDSGVYEDFNVGFPWMERIEVPEELGYSSVRVSVNYFIASP